MMLKRLLIATALSALVAGPALAATTTLKLTEVITSPERTKTLRQIVKLFEDANPGVHVEITSLPWGQAFEKFATMVSAGDTPDVVEMPDRWQALYGDSGRLENLDPYLAKWSETKDLNARALEMARVVGGKAYSLPYGFYLRAMFYNKALFKQAGIAEPPKTWAQFEAAAKKVADLGNGAIGYGLPLGPEEAQGEFSIWAFNNGGDWKKDGKWTVNSPENVETLTFLKSLATKKLTQNNPGKTNRQDAFDLFASGKVGMVVGFSPLAATLDKDGKVDYGVAPMPTKADGGTPQTFGVTDYLMAFKKKGNQDAVKAFYDLYYQKDQVNQFIKAEGFLPVTKSGIQEFSSDAALKTYLDTLPNAHLTPTDDPTWDKVKLAVQQNLGTAVTGDPKAVLDKLQTSAENGAK
jgi:multiple sugar transport system substrate-binding protein